MELLSMTQIAALSIFFTAILSGAWRLLNWVWFRPRRLERLLRKQGFKGRPYRVLFGDLKENAMITNQARSKPIALSDNVLKRVVPLLHQTVEIYGKNSFIWLGPTPRVSIMNPEHIKDAFTKISKFRKTSNATPLIKLLVTGLVSYEDDKWANHRKIVNPAFHLEKLKLMTPVFYQSCHEMINLWEKMVTGEGSYEMDVWPSVQNLTRDIISRTAFGSNYEEGKMIFHLLKEQSKLVFQALQSVYLPGWRFLPTKTNNRMKANHKEIEALLRAIIKKGEEAVISGIGNINDNLLGLLLESNYREIQEQTNNKNAGMSYQDVIEECKLFYFAGQETTSALLAWTLILLGQHQNWQTRAREEVLQVLGHSKPDFDGLNQLKVVTMILYEVLRLYPPATIMVREIYEDIKLGDLLLPAGVQVLLPTIMIHRDPELWGDDASEFNPERFREGMAKATKNQVSFFPFGWGPRICVGLNFAMLEAKMALAMILQHFSFELGPSYAHAPLTVVTLQPQYGAHLVLHKL